MKKNGTTQRMICHRGFTLIELLIVIAILLALIGIVAGTYLAVSDQSDVDLQRFQIEMIDKEMERFKLDMKRYPTEEEGLAALWDKSVLETEEDEAKWKGYLEEPVTTDKWGSELVYYAPSTLSDGAPYDIISPGPDREEGTEDDITNHQGSGSATDGSSEEDFTIE